MAETKNTNVFPKVVNGVTYGEKFVDFDGLDYFWGRAKDYVDKADAALGGRIDTEKGRIDNLVAIVNELTGTGEGSQGASIADRINAAIEALELDKNYEKVGVAEEKANAAKDAAIESAKGYTDGAVAGLKTDLEGQLAEGVQGAKDYSDGQLAAAKTELQGYADQAELDAIAAAKTYSDGLNEAMDGRMQAVESGVAGVDGKITAAFNDFAQKVSDDNVVNTYKELIDYAAEHGAEFTELVGVVNGKADKTYVDEQDAALAGRVKALEDHSNDYVAADKALETTLRGEIATAKSGAETVAAAYTDQKVGALAGTVSTLTETVASNLTEAKTYAEQKAAAAEAAAKADTVEKLKNYTNSTDMAAAIQAAKEAAIADAQGKIATLSETVAKKADTTYVDSKDAEVLASAKAYASAYTDELFNSIVFVSENDINGIFEK